MFEAGLFRGQRVRVWRPVPRADAARLKIVIPGASSGSGRRLVVPGVPYEAELVRRELGIGSPCAVDQLVDDGGSTADRLAHTAAVFDLLCWRGRIGSAGPGPRLLTLLRSRPDDLDPGAVPAGDHGPVLPEHSLAAAVLDGVVARRRLMASLAADEARDLELVSRCYPGVAQFLPTEIGQALHLSDGAAGALMDRAEQLVRRLPGTLAALENGTIGVEAAEAIVAGTRTTSAGVAAEVEAVVLPRAATRSAEKTYRSCAYQVGRRDPDGLRRRHRLAVADRHLSRTVLPDGMAALRMVAAAQDVAAVWEAVTGLADASKSAGDDRDLGQRRVDALVDLSRDVLDRGGYRATRLPARQRTRPQVHVTMPLSALLGGDAPAHLQGHGWISADQARQIAADADLRRLVCDPVSGVLLDYGRTVYKPPKVLADFVIARDRSCPVPGCRHPARRGQLDHIQPAKPDPSTGRPTAGTTSPDNLAAPCHHHHLAKDGRGFTLTRAPDGSYQLRTPLGRTTTRDPLRLLESPDDQLERLEQQQWQSTRPPPQQVHPPPTPDDRPAPF